MKLGPRLRGGDTTRRGGDSGRGFAVDARTLPSTARVTHVSLFDGSLQGLARADCPAFCFQGHPEASPGPHDIDYLFDRFAKLMEEHKRADRGTPVASEAV